MPLRQALDTAFSCRMSGMTAIEALRKIRSNQPFLDFLGIEVEDAGPGWVRERLLIRDTFLQPEVVHGGVIYALADTSTAHCVLTRIYPDEWCTTVTQNINFMKPVSSGAILCNARL